MSKKFTELLTEASEAQELIQTLNTGNYYGVPVDKRLYRGAYGSIDTFKKRKIRKDREPKDTSELIDGIVEEVREKYFSKMPSRQRAVFVSGKQKVARAYGDQTVYVFIPKSAKCAWSQADAFTDFFSAANKNLDILKNLVESRKEELKTGKIEGPFKAFLDFALCLSFCETDTIRSLYKSNYKYYKRPKKILDFGKLSNLQKSIAVQIREMSKNIEHYFDELNIYNGGVSSKNIHEMIVEGDHFIIANIQWFNRTVEEKLNKR